MSNLISIEDALIYVFAQAKKYTDVNLSSSEIDSDQLADVLGDIFGDAIVADVYANNGLDLIGSEV